MAGDREFLGGEFNHDGFVNGIRPVINGVGEQFLNGGVRVVADVVGFRFVGVLHDEFADDIVFDEGERLRELILNGPRERLFEHAVTFGRRLVDELNARIAKEMFRMFGKHEYGHVARYPPFPGKVQELHIAGEFFGGFVFGVVGE